MERLPSMIEQFGCKAFAIFSFISRLIKSSSMCILGCQEETYKLLRGYPYPRFRTKIMQVTAEVQAPLPTKITLRVQR